MNSVRQWWSRFVRQWQAARTRRELHGLSDHLLKDIGLKRADIDELFR